MDKQADRCTFEITIPVNMTALFVLPKNCDHYTQLTLNGVAVTPQQLGTLHLIDPLESGTHILIAN